MVILALFGARRTGNIRVRTRDLLDFANVFSAAEQSGGKNVMGRFLAATLLRKHFRGQ